MRAIKLGRRYTISVIKACQVSSVASSGRLHHAPSPNFNFKRSHYPSVRRWRNGRPSKHGTIREEPQILACIRLDLYMLFPLSSRILLYLYCTSYHRQCPTRDSVYLGRHRLQSFRCCFPPNEWRPSSNVRPETYSSDNRWSLCTRQWYLWSCK